MKTETENIAADWLMKHFKEKEKKLIEALDEHNLVYKVSDMFYNEYEISYKEDVYLYLINYGRWQRQGQKKEDTWYHCKSPKQFIEDYIINSPYR